MIVATDPAAVNKDGPFKSQPALPATWPWKCLCMSVIPMSMLFYTITSILSVRIKFSLSSLFKTPRAATGYGFTATTFGCIYFAAGGGVVIRELFGHSVDWCRPHDFKAGSRCPDSSFETHLGRSRTR